MARHETRWTNERLDQAISTILRLGVTAAAVVVFAGGVYYLIRHGGETPNYQHFRGQPPQLRTVSGIIGFALASHSRGIIELGLLLLIATPVARVALSVLVFALERDRGYVAVTLFVLGLLLYSLFASG